MHATYELGKDDSSPEFQTAESAHMECRTTPLLTLTKQPRQMMRNLMIAASERACDLEEVLWYVCWNAEP